MQKLAAIVGPTASGKTGLAIKTAQRINAEILSCDSMQIYRGMNIGTAKASIQEQGAIPHHLIDIAAVDEDFSTAAYQRRAKQLIEQLNHQGIIPLMAGGTGLYYQSVVDDYQFFPMDTRQTVRDRLNHQIEMNGLEPAYIRLQGVDPEYASIISPNDQKRIVRALEVYEMTGHTFSSFQKRSQDTYLLAAVGLRLEREELYHRIDVRVDQMMEEGLIEEVAGFMKKYTNCEHLNSMQALGYKQTLAYLKGFISKSAMVEEIKRETRRYAKRQLTWFNKDKRIFWVNAGENNSEEEIVQNICAYIEGRFKSV